MRVLSEVVYRLNNIGPRTEPWGPPHVREDQGERCGGGGDGRYARRYV